MTSPSDVERVRDAIRFAEEYGFRGWLQAQDELNAILKQIQTLTEERDEAIIRERTFYNNWQEARANEAAQIAKGLELAAQLDQARALLQQFGTRKPDGQPTTWARAKDVEAFLQPSNEEREEIAP